VKIKVPPKDFYTINELSERWGWSLSDIEHFIFQQCSIRVCIKPEKIYLDYNGDKWPSDPPNLFPNGFQTGEKLIVKSSTGEVVWKISPFEEEYGLVDSVHSHLFFIDLQTNRKTNKYINDRLKMFVKDSKGSIEYKTNIIETPAVPRTDLIYFESLELEQGEELELKIECFSKDVRQLVLGYGLCHKDSVYIPYREIESFEQVAEQEQIAKKSIGKYFKCPSKNPNEAAIHICKMGNKFIEINGREPTDIELKNYILTESGQYGLAQKYRDGGLTIGGTPITKRGFKDRFKSYLTDSNEY